MENSLFSTCVEKLQLMGYWARSGRAFSLPQLPIGWTRWIQRRMDGISSFRHYRGGRQKCNEQSEL